MQIKLWFLEVSIPWSVAYCESGETMSIPNLKTVIEDAAVNKSLLFNSGYYAKQQLFPVKKFEVL